MAKLSKAWIASAVLSMRMSQTSIYKTHTAEGTTAFSGGALF
jgi:hypothetical protein